MSTDPELAALDARLRREAGYPADWREGDPTPPPKVDARTLSPEEYRKAKAAWTSYAGKVDRIRAERAAMAKIQARFTPKGTP